MCKKKLLWILCGVIALSCALFFAGCGTTPVPYSFAPEGLPTAQIKVVSGNPGLTLVSCENNKVPGPEENTHWEPFLLVPDKPAKIIVHAKYEHSAIIDKGLFVMLVSAVVAGNRSVSKEVLFECPPLEAEKTYKLAYKKGMGFTGKNTLVLTEDVTGKKIKEHEFIND